MIKTSRLLLIALLLLGVGFILEDSRSIPGSLRSFMALVSGDLPDPVDDPAASPSPILVPSPGQVTLIGNPEVVFNAPTQGCEYLDIPDAPARAFRDAAGRVN